MRGSRVRGVVQELKGERVDIVVWDDDAAIYASNALSPAQISRVLMDEEQHVMTVIVPEDQLSLAIGRRGQNVKLAAKLMSWRLDIISEEESRRREAERRKMMDLPGVDPFQVAKLARAGIHSMEALSEVTEVVLAEALEIDVEAAASLRQAAKDAFEAEVIAATGGETELLDEPLTEQQEAAQAASPESESESEDDEQPAAAEEEAAPSAEPAGDEAKGEPA
jgi:N utilization substance protein A